MYEAVCDAKLDHSCVFGPCVRGIESPIVDHVKEEGEGGWIDVKINDPGSRPAKLLIVVRQVSKELAVFCQLRPWLTRGKPTYVP